MDSAWREITRASAAKANVKKRARHSRRRKIFPAGKKLPRNPVPLFCFIPRRDELSCGI
jgi:hypothetical protein